MYYKGEGGGYPQVWAVMSLVSPSCPWLVLTPKVPQLCINHLVLVLCRSVWVNEACHFFLVPSQNSSTPFYPSIVLRARECASTPCPFTIFSLGFTFEPLKELGVRHNIKGFLFQFAHHCSQFKVYNFVVMLNFFPSCLFIVRSRFNICWNNEILLFMFAHNLLKV
jgi:hypothetical protein